MKKLFLTIILIVLWGPIIRAQGATQSAELIINFENRYTGWEIRVNIDAIGEYWDELHYLSDEYPGGERYSRDQVYPFNKHWSAACWFNPIFEPLIGLGLYKVTLTQSNPSGDQVSFYINWRTSGLPPGPSEWDDQIFNYDLRENKIYSYYDPNETSIDGEVINAWDVVENLDHLTSDLEDYWDYCLEVTEDADHHPRLVWGPYPTDIGIYEYKIYRKHGSSAWGLFDEVDDEVYTYTDETVTITQTGGQAGADVYYYVKGAFYEDEVEILTASTDTVEVNVVGGDIEKRANGYINTNELSFSLSQNYPNPFNPSTFISWQSPVDNFVRLKVFDILGREVATLINEYKEAGFHSVEFNASDIPSGVYIYSIQIGKYTENRKLILQK